jgi:hypothetical protein
VYLTIGTVNHMAKTKLLLVCVSLIAAGCAEFPASPGELMTTPLDQGSEIQATVPVPVTMAYQNILSKATSCWQREDRAVEGDPFTPEDGFARVSLRIVANFMHGNIYPTVIDLLPETEDSCRLIARSMYVGDKEQAPGLADFPNLMLWAEGKDAPCQ